MQRVCELPKELQVGVLMWAIEPTPTAAILKAAIGNKHGMPRWWWDVVGKDNGDQKYLNYHTHCHRLWSRTLEVRHDGSLAWKWSQTNMFLNKSGKPHARGNWEDLVNEIAIRRNIRRKPPVDKFLHEGVMENRYNQQVRALYVNVPESGYGVPDDLPQIFPCTCNRVALADRTSGDFRLDWYEDENWRGEYLNGIVRRILAEPV
jgi:hypothetical protein